LLSVWHRSKTLAVHHDPNTGVVVLEFWLTTSL
jgi:hypothetical protein